GARQIFWRTEPSLPRRETRLDSLQLIATVGEIEFLWSVRFDSFFLLPGALGAIKKHCREAEPVPRRSRPSPQPTNRRGSLSRPALRAALACPLEAAQRRGRRTRLLCERDSLLSVAFDRSCSHETARLTPSKLLSLRAGCSSIGVSSSRVG